MCVPFIVNFSKPNVNFQVWSLYQKDILTLMQVTCWIRVFLLDLLTCLWDLTYTIICLVVNFKQIFWLNSKILKCNYFVAIVLCCQQFISCDIDKEINLNSLLHDLGKIPTNNPWEFAIENHNKRSGHVNEILCKDLVVHELKKSKNPCKHVRKVPVCGFRVLGFKGKP